MRRCAAPSSEADAGRGDAFRPNERGRWQCDLAALARQRLVAAGIGAISGAAACTYSDAARFYSHRREQPTGRMAALVWIGPEPGGANPVLESTPPEGNRT